jgi:drug/metabolite transporter (DMT)-like permease
MLALVLALACSIAYGCADFAGGLAARGAHVLRVCAITAPASLLVELALVPFAGADFSPGAVWWGAASGVASAAAFALLYLTLALGPMSILSPITALVSGGLPVVVGLAAGETLTSAGAIGIPVAAAAILLISAAPDAERRRPPAGPLLLAIAAGAAIAAQLVSLDQAPADSGVAPLVVGRAVSSLLVLSAAFAARSRLGEARPDLKLSSAAGALDSLANFAFLLAVREGELAIVAVITALYPAATLLLARAVLGERVSAPQAAGLGVAAAAVVLLALA